MLSKNHNLKTLAIAASLCVLGLIIFMADGLLDVFKLADPTGSFGAAMKISAFCANICTLFIAALVLMQKPDEKLVSSKAAFFILGVKLCEVITIAPCLVGYGEAFCGLFWVIFTNFMSPLIVLIAAATILLSSSKTVVKSGIAMAVILLVMGIGAIAVLTPKTPEQCTALPGITERAACLHKFALKANSGDICKQIEFRSTRFQCLYNVAERTTNPDLCVDIEDAPGTTIAAYESPSVATRDLCYYLLGFKMHSRDQCLKVTDQQMQQTCINGAGVPGQKRRLF